MAVWRNPAKLAFDEAWEILDAEPGELSHDQRRLRSNLARRWRERRRPFTREAIHAAIGRMVEQILRDAGLDR